MILLLGLAVGVPGAMAADGSFADSLAQAGAAARKGDLPAAIKIYAATRRGQERNSTNLCVLAHRYCDLTYLTNSPSAQKSLLADALACARQAVTDAPTNATAHASLAVCYAKSCAFANIKTELADSRLFKIEAEKAIALDPKEDTAYYLLGRWNYEIAKVGLLSRAYVRVVYGGLPHASYQEAVRDFKKAIALAPNRILHHAGLAMAYQALGEQKLEVQQLKKCLALKPIGAEDIAAQKDAARELRMENR